jgi:selenocysteine-specific elongation factor
MSNAHTIIGTAGHVDHGKTSLIKALTGIDTDRLKEEKKRGITIENGYAYLTLPDGSRAGIIDVPGHEKFIHNMLAGASSVDLALLIVAADEGIMPQTREHLDILSLLHIERGAVALTKADLVEKDWLEMVADDIHSELKDTFLRDAPIIPVSSHTGEGLQELKTCLFDLLQQSPPKADYIPFRLPVDRVFTSDGFGAVVTGTLTEGKLSVGDTVTIYPALKTAKVRNLQTHGEKVDSVSAGQRTAVNLSGVSHNELSRGLVLAAPGSMSNKILLDVRLDVLKGTARKLLHGSQLHFHHGTHDLLCKPLLFDRQSVAAGESVYAQIQLSEPLAVKPGDRFVLRFFSPLETVGGGIILDHSVKKYTRRDKNNIDGFTVKENGSLRERISQSILDRSKSFPLLDEVKLLSFENNPQFDEEAATLIKNGELITVGDKKVIHRQFFDETGEQCKELLAAYHTKNPLNAGMPKSELWRPLLPKADAATANKVIDLLERHGIIKFAGNLAANLNFNVVISGQHQKLSDEIVKELLNCGFSTPSYDEMAQAHEKERTAFKQAFDALVREGSVIMLTPQIIIHKSYFEKAKDTFKTLAKNKAVTLQEFRDELNTSRKYAIAILDYFDLQHFTVKKDDCRVLK